MCLKKLSVGLKTNVHIQIEHNHGDEHYPTIHSEIGENILLCYIRK
jgi:hypothetical protein